MGGHILLRIDFYDAIAGKIWCWFHDNAPHLLEDYTNYHWWPPLPDIPHSEFVNSEIFGLGLAKHVTALSGLVDLDTITAVAKDRNLNTHITNMSDSATWYCYNENWGPWGAMTPPFPLTGTLRPQYDYAGADAAVRIETATGRLTPGPRGLSITNVITWSAAAKPFGYLNDEDKPNLFGLVLPAYHEVRLIPVDASSAPSGGSFNLDWRKHIEEHLPDYMETGPGRSDCWYCIQLITWEDPAFRQEGADWLKQFGNRCDTGGGGGGGMHGGGTRRGH